MTFVLWTLGVLAAGAVLLLVLARWPRLALASGVGAMLIGGLLCTASAVSGLRGLSSADAVLQWSLPLGTAHLALDGLSAWFVLTIGALAAAVAPYSWSYFHADADGRRSRQIDIAIYDHLYSPLIFPHDSGIHIPAESVYAIFEVKQALTRQLLFDAGRNRGLRGYRPGGGRNPSFAEPLVCPSLLLPLAPNCTVAGLPAWRPEGEEPWIYDGRLVVRLRR